MSGKTGTELLEDPGKPGYPVDYLLSRVRARGSRLVSDWEPLLEEDMGEYLSGRSLSGMGGDPLSLALWQRLVREFRWVYSQMNATVRGVFWPFFVYAELRTIFICMRQRQKAQTPGADALLSLSLLGGGVKKALVSSNDQAITARSIEHAFSVMSRDFQGIADSVKERGLRDFEIQLTDRHLAFARRTAQEAFMRRFFTRLIDARNLIKAYKSVRFSTALRPQWISGGGIPPETLDAIADSGDVFSFLPVIRRHTGMAITTPHIGLVEGALYRGITRSLRTEARDPLHVSTVLYYLWRVSLETTNLSLLLHGRDIPKEALSQELVH